jgi:hypothetical protein
MNGSRKALASIVLLVLAAACRPASPTSPGGEKAGQAAAPAAGAQAPVVTPATVDQLSELQLASPMKWMFAEGVGAAPALEVSRSGAGNALALTTTSDTGRHRVGIEANYGDAPKTFHITVWVKGSPGTDVMLEASGAAKNGAAPADYAVTYFDLAKNAVQPNVLVTDETKFPTAAITADGEWRKLATTMATRDGSINLVIGATHQGQHVFTGGPGLGFVIGGVEIQTN